MDAIREISSPMNRERPKNWPGTSPFLAWRGNIIELFRFEANAWLFAFVRLHGWEPCHQRLLLLILASGFPSLTPVPAGWFRGDQHARWRQGTAKLPDRLK